MMRKLLGLVIDFWVALYMIMPAMVFLVLGYVNWLRALPVWFLPAYLPELLGILTIVVVAGIPRTYLAKADIVIIHRYQPTFRTIFKWGMAASISLQSITTVIVLILLYPFYHHVSHVALFTWMLVSIWVLVVKATFLVINHRVFMYLPTWAYRVAKLPLSALFILSWTVTVSPFISAPGLTAFSLPILGALFWLATASAVTRLLPVGKWDNVVADEEHRDLNTMKMFLGPTAQAGRQGTKSGRAWLGRGRLGIGFRKEKTLTYFLVKYLLRSKILRKQYAWFLFGGLLFVLTPLAALFKVMLMLGLLLVTALWLEAVWQQESDDLFVKMLPLQRKEISKSMGTVYRLLLLPMAILFLLVPILGRGTWPAGVTGLLFLLVASIVVSAYFAVKNSFLRN